MTITSAYWLGEHWLTNWRNTKKGTPEYAIRLSAIRRGVSNFVRIITGEEIPVRYSSGKMSYATREEGIVISANNDPDRLDETVGTALHESAHLILSQRSDHSESIPLYTWLMMCELHILKLLSPNALDAAVVIGLDERKLGRLFKMVLNVMEDRRIDSWMYEHAEGYRPYYDEFYAHCWHSKSISGLLNSPWTRIPTLKNYEFHVINFSNPDAPGDALPGLQQIRDLINLPKIRRFGLDPSWKDEFSLILGRKTYPEMIRVALQVVEIILTHAQPSAEASSQTSASTGASLPPDDPNLDISDEQREVDRAVEEELTRLGDFLVNVFDKERLAPSLEAQMRVMEESKAEVFKVGDEIGLDVSVTKFGRLTESVLKNPQFPYSYYQGRTLKVNEQSADAVRLGERMGDALAHQLLLLSDEHELIFPRQLAGKLDNRQVWGLGCGELNVFATRRLESHKPVHIHLSIDASLSMAGSKWTHSLALGVALAKAASKIDRLNVVVSLRAGDRDSRTSQVTIAILHDSRVDKFAQVRQLFPFLTMTYCTPEGLAFEALRQEVLLMPSESRRYFINISDGHPEMNVFTTQREEIRYEGDGAIEHTRRQIDEFTNSGISVMSYFVSEGGSQHGDAFRQMYGKFAEFINPKNVADITRTLNSLLNK